MNKVFIVQYSTGTWEAYKEHIEKIFSIRENAEDFIDEQKKIIERKVREGKEKFGILEMDDEMLFEAKCSWDAETRIEYENFHDDYISHKYLPIVEMEISDYNDVRHNNE